MYNFKNLSDFEMEQMKKDIEQAQKTFLNKKNTDVSVVTENDNALACEHCYQKLDCDNK